MSVVPNGWAHIKLSDVAEYVTSGARHWSKYYADAGVMFVRTQDINTNRLVLTNVARMNLPPEERSERTRIENGDLLYTVTGANVGKCAVAAGVDEEAYPSQSVALVRLKEKSLAAFLHLASIAPNVGKAQLEGMAYGLGRPVLNLDNIRDLRLPVAPMAEQRRIIAKIEELFSDLDAGVAALERVRAKLKRYRASVLNAAVTGKLTEAWRQQNPPVEPADKLLARILDERRKAWEAEQLRKFAEAKKTLPKGWQAKFATITSTATSTVDADGWITCRLDTLCEVGTGTTPSRANAAYYNGTIPWVTSGAVNAPFVSRSDEHVTETALAETRLRVYPKHTLIVALYGEGKTRGKVSELLIPATVNQALGTLTMHPGGDECRRYLKTFLHASYLSLRHQAAGGVQPNLNLGLLSATPIRLPPLAEQAEIVAEVERRLSVVEAVEAEVEHGLKRAARLRQAILKRAFEGKLVPQDPADEPASALLERLRQSPVAATPAKRTSRRRPPASVTQIDGPR